jgi:hypothetical protein
VRRRAVFVRLEFLTFVSNGCEYGTVFEFSL